MLKISLTMPHAYNHEIKRFTFDINMKIVRITNWSVWVRKLIANASIWWIGSSRSRLRCNKTRLEHSPRQKEVILYALFNLH